MDRPIAGVRGAGQGRRGRTTAYDDGLVVELAGVTDPAGDHAAALDIGRAARVVVDRQGLQRRRRGRVRAAHRAGKCDISAGAGGED